MCTLTWWSDCDGGGTYQVFFNRDERKTREPALPPERRTWKGTRVLAPVDPRGGGTWILANEHGVTIALLNWYEREAGPESKEGRRSRGRLVADLADVDSLATADARVRGIDGGCYPPFRLVMLFPGTATEGFAVKSWKWPENGRLREDVPEMPVCSSSYETSAVLAGRKEKLEAWREKDEELSPETLDRFHHGDLASGQEEPPSAWSVRMNRSDAQTWSISRITVTDSEVWFRYEAEGLDLGEAPRVSETRLERAGQP